MKLPRYSWYGDTRLSLLTVYSAEYSSVYTGTVYTVFIYMFVVLFRRANRRRRGGGDEGEGGGLETELLESFVNHPAGHSSKFEEFHEIRRGLFRILLNLWNIRNMFINMFNRIFYFYLVK